MYANFIENNNNNFIQGVYTIYMTHILKQYIATFSMQMYPHFMFDQYFI